MTNPPILREPYIPAGCCHPIPGDRIVGFHSHDAAIKVHRGDCANLSKAESARLVPLEWPEILAEEEERPGSDFGGLDTLDFRVLRHHREFGVDYSLKVAAMLHESKQSVFDSHAKLRSMELLERIEPTMIRYRKGVVKSKWIKHRNHTYFDLTAKGKMYLQYHERESRGG